MAEVALRWVSHHSLMKHENGDAILIGASSLAHIEQVCSPSSEKIQICDSFVEFS